MKSRTESAYSPQVGRTVALGQSEFQKASCLFVAGLLRELNYCKDWVWGEAHDQR
jgi:hypothetical protein